MIAVARMACVSALAVAPLAAAPPRSPLPHVARGDVPYETLAREFLGARADTVEPSAAGLESLLAEDFTRFELGAFDLLYPRAALADNDGAARFRAAAVAVLNAHRTWAEWIDPAGERLKGTVVAADAKEIGRWIGAWKPADLAAVKPGAELAASLPAKEKERAALERFAALFADGGLPRTSGSEAAAARRARLVLVPDRKTFVRMCCAVGWLLPDLRSIYWQPGIVSWVEFRFEDTRVVGLEFATSDVENWERGSPMDERNPKGLEEQIAQLAYGTLALACFSNRIDPDFSQSLCNNLVIDLYGEVDTRSDGDLRPRSAPGRSMFVPGGNSSGGTLPPNSAESPWRVGYGADHFVKILAETQKRGIKESGDRGTVARFLLVSDDGGERFVAKPPFFGPASEATVLPPDRFRGDWLEFQRAYRVAFCHWLRNEAAAGKKASHQAFAEVLARLAAPSSPTETVDFAAVLEEAYGVPVSTPEPGPDDLEGRFLIWLSRQR